MSTFFSEVNNVNIFGFNKQVVNVQKLKDDLEADEVFGPKFDFFVATDGRTRVHCSEALNQAEIEALNSVINNFVEQDAFTVEQGQVETYTRRGFELCRKIVADIRIKGGLSGYLDDDQIPGYKELEHVRMKLKDGFFEYALRYFVTEIKPLSLIPTDQSDLYIEWIETEARNVASASAIPEEVISQSIELMKTVPKGHYPFGKIGAPE